MNNNSTLLKADNPERIAFLLIPFCNFTMSQLTRIRKTTAEMTEKDKAWSFWNWLYNF